MGHIRTLPPETHGPKRLDAIMARLLKQMEPRLKPHAGKLRLAASLCLPERMDARTGLEEHRRERPFLEASLEGKLSEMGHHTTVTSYCLGHAAFARAVIDAADVLRGRQIDAVLIGGLETGYDPHVVQHGLSAGRIFDGENVESFCAGEGGAFFLLCSASFARQMEWPVHARIDGVARAHEAAHLYNDLPCLGAGLTAAAGVLTKPLRESQGRIDWWLHDMTNEFYRVHEFRCAWPRTSYQLMNQSEFPFTLHNQFGDLGAAFMPTAIALAGETFKRGGPQSSNCMITGSSLYGERGAIIASGPSSEPSYQEARR
jgi:3-oxoacyl-[acyl-carrier-protein] synthase-1